MNSSNIIVRINHQSCKNLKSKVTRTISYIGNKEKADASCIDKNNVLKEYMVFNDNESYLYEESESFIWSMNGDVDAKADLKKIDDLDKSGTLWSLIISFPQEFALNNGLVTKGDFYQLTTNILPTFFSNCGFNLNNLTWYCSLHRNTKNPHLHINFFEHKRSKFNPIIPYSSIYKLKSNIANYLIDNKSFYKLRDEEFKNITSTISIKELTEVKNQKLFNDTYRKELNKMLLDLYAVLPKNGRLQYNSKNMERYKKDLNEIIEYILMHNSTKYNYAKYLRLLENHQQELNSLYGDSKANQDKKYYYEQINKLYSKIGNEILANYKIYQSTDFMEKEKLFLKKHIHELNFKSRNDYAKENTKIEIAKGLYKICQLADLNYNETKKVFDKWIKNSNYNFNSEELLVLVTSLDTDMSTTDYYKYLNKLNYNSERYNKLKSKYFYKDLNYKIFINRAFNYLKYELEQEEKQIINEIEYRL